MENITTAHLTYIETQGNPFERVNVKYTYVHVQSTLAKTDTFRSGSSVRLGRESVLGERAYHCKNMSVTLLVLQFCPSYARFPSYRVSVLAGVHYICI